MEPCPQCHGIGLIAVEPAAGVSWADGLVYVDGRTMLATRQPDGRVLFKDT
jgi:hypothetical protein